MENLLSFFIYFKLYWLRNISWRKNVQLLIQNVFVLYSIIQKSFTLRGWQLFNSFTRMLRSRRWAYILSSTDWVLLYPNSTAQLDTLDATSWDQNPPNFTLGELLTVQPFRHCMSAQEFNAFCINFRLFTSYIIGYRSGQFVRIRLIVRVFDNGRGHRGSIPGRIIVRTQKWYSIPLCLTVSIIRYGSRVKKKDGREKF